MKKIFSLILTCIVAISLFGCREGSGNEQVSNRNVQNVNFENGEKKLSYKYGNTIKAINFIYIDKEIYPTGTANYNGNIFRVQICPDEKNGIASYFSYYDLKGNIVDYKKSLNGLNVFDKNKKQGLVDSDGTVVLKPNYEQVVLGSDDITAYKDDTTFIFDKNLNTLFKHKSGNWTVHYSHEVVVNKAHYTSIPHLKESLINLPNKEDKWGFVDINGKDIIDFKYLMAFNYINGYACVVNKDKHGENKFGLINKKGELIIDYQYDRQLVFNNGISSANKNGIGYYINLNNEQVLDGLLFEQTNGFYENLASVKMNEKWGFIDTNGTEVFPCIFDYVTSFENGIAFATYKNCIVVLTYLDPSELGFTDVDVDNAYAKLNQIDGSSYWTDLRRKQANNISKENWSNKDYEDDFNYTLTYKGVQPNTWYVTGAGVWYYFENDRTTRKTGWYNEPKDGQTYYLNPTNGVMATGWTEIDGDMYYFNEEHSSTPNWYYIPESDSWESHGKNIKAYGSMYRDETTPDGKKVDKDGKLIK